MGSFNRRVGKFKLPLNYHTSFGDEDLRMIFDGFIPLHMDVQFHMGVVVFTGIHPTFDTITEGSVPPEYVVWIREEAGKEKFRLFEKKPADKGGS